MVRKSGEIALDNIVRIKAGTNPDSYIQAIFLRMQPRTYYRYKCIKIRCVGKLLKTADWLCRVFWHAGMVVQDIRKMEEGLQVDRGTYLEDAFEITMCKIGAIDFADDSKYESFYDKLKELKRQKKDE